MAAGQGDVYRIVSTVSSLLSISQFLQYSLYFCDLLRLFVRISNISVLSHTAIVLAIRVEGPYQNYEVYTYKIVGLVIARTFGLRVELHTINLY